MALKGVRRATAGGSGNVVGPASSTDEAVARFDGATGQLLQNSLFLISDTGVASGIVSLSINGAAIGANALAVSGAANISGNLSGGALIPTDSTVPSGIGIYSTNTTSTMNFAASGSQRWSYNNLFMASATSGGFRFTYVSPSDTVPNILPNSSQTTTGLGGAAGVPAMIVGGATIESWTSTGAVIASGKAFQLGNAATTGLVAGVLAATTNASVVITDSAGQAYRIPCII